MSQALEASGKLLDQYRKLLCLSWAQGGFRTWQVQLAPRATAPGCSPNAPVSSDSRGSQGRGERQSAPFPAPPTSPELRDCIQKTLNEWSSQISPDLVREFPDVLECTVSHAIEKINPDEREEMKVSAKLFIVGSNSSSSTKNAIDMACSVLGVAHLDSVIIASPPIEDGVHLSLEHLQPYWEELENLVQSKKIVAIGTSDLDKTQLEQLYQWAQVKPNSNQVNLASCCVMPPDLTAFAKQFDIQLLTHNDPKELLSEASFQEALEESIPDIQAHDWVPLWLLRYSVIVKSRGIIKSKGYILQAKRRGS
ncbi:glutamate--cysteine ligase regulatory subunit [Echinops telfairi]|uniref:GCS light chain n=1 Tax=Echinops telfairi TaxID=9371 RepID=A0ABM0ZPL2_ECHTE|nr:glutamate--cysteine ligase regulatory subunit [Echinops telfairi]